jgi:hypothetical protein
MAARDPHEPKRHTGGRTDRPKDRRRLRADILLARTEWLGDPLVWWTGRRRGSPSHAFEEAPIPDFLPRVAESHLADAAPALYALTVRFTGQEEPPLSLEARAATRVDGSLLAGTARAVNTARRFPKVIGRKVGSLSRWQARAEARARVARRCLDTAEDATALSALALEEDTVWLGSAPPPSQTQPTEALAEVVSRHPTTEHPCSRIAAVTLGQRRHRVRLASPLLPWYSLATRLDAWRASNVVSLAEILGVERALSLVSSAPWVNSRNSEAVVQECRLARGLVEPEAARDLLALLGEGDPPSPAGVEARLRSFSLALRFRALGVPATPRTMASWAEMVGAEGAFVRPTRGVSARRWSSVLHESLVAVGDRLRLEREDLLDPAVAASFREWVRRAAPLGPRALSILLDFKPWRAAQPSQSLSFRRELVSQVVVERAIQWLGALRTRAREGPRAHVAGGGPPSRGGAALPYAALELGNVEAREGVLEVGTLLARARSVPWGTLVSLLDELSQDVDWQRLPKSLARPAAGRWVGHVAALLARTHPPGADEVDGAAIAAAGFVVAWCEHGFVVDHRLVRLLATREGTQIRQLIQRCDEDTRELALRLSDGDIRRLRNALLLGQRPRRHSWPLLPAWRLVERFRELRAGIQGCFDRPELVARAARMLDRLALAIQLSPGAALPRRLAALEESVEEIELPPFLPPEAARMLCRLAHLSRSLDRSDGLPGPVRRILRSPEAMLEERTALRRRAATRGLNEGQRARLEALERLRQDPALVDGQVARQLAKALPKHLAVATLAALEVASQAEVRGHWKTVLAGPDPGAQVPDNADWDNAIAMVRSVSHNRRILRDLLRHEILGDRAWIRTLPGNCTFATSLSQRGLDAEAWLAARSRRLASSAGELVAYVATDPLEILQMGNLFGTCLSADGGNAHAAVAAAVEINKRVLYLRDAHGRIQGRKLLALTPDGQLLGFHSYGSGEPPAEHAGPPARKPGRDAAALPDVRPWVKLAFDLLSLDVARATSARLRRQVDEAEVRPYLTDEETRSLQLFCRGYFDRLEPFDWWIECLSRERPPESARDRALVRQWLTTGPPAGVPGDEARSWETCRAVLWLGSRAPSLTPARAGELGLGRAQLSVLAGHSPSPTLRREARRALTAVDAAFGRATSPPGLADLP